MSARMVPVGPGRIPFYDPRNELFRVRAVAPPLGSIARRARYWWANGWWEDQGPLPHCTAAAALHWREDGPVTTAGPPEIGRAALYDRIVAVDRAEGRHYSAGATALAMVKTIQEMGWCGEYRWAYTLSELVAAVLTMGPVVVGTNWYSAMSVPDERGVIVPAGRLEGGHAYVINGVSLEREEFRAKNSWSRGWGRRGHCAIRFSDMARLLQEDGEACLARELPEPAVRAA